MPIRKRVLKVLKSAKQPCRCFLCSKRVSIKRSIETFRPKGRICTKCIETRSPSYWKEIKHRFANVKRS